MAKKIKAVVKLNLPAGVATPAQPVGPALGQHGIVIMDFVKQYNERTASQKGTILPAVITIYEDRSFDFVVKTPPVSVLLKKALGLEKGAKAVGRETVGKVNQKQLEEIAKQKMVDLNAKNLEAAKKIVAGTARSMGIEIG